MIPTRNEAIDAHADQFIARISEYGFGLAVDERYKSLRIDDQQCRRRRFDDQTQSLFSLTAFGYFAQHAAHAQRLAVRIDFDLAAHHDPADPAIGTGDPVFSVEFAAAPDRLRDRGLQLVAVRRRQALVEAIAVPLLGGAEPEQMHSGLGHPRIFVHEVATPQSHARASHRHLHALLGVAQLCFRNAQALRQLRGAQHVAAEFVAHRQQHGEERRIDGHWCMQRAADDAVQPHGREQHEREHASADQDQSAAVLAPAVSYPGHKRIEQEDKEQYDGGQAQHRPRVRHTDRRHDRMAAPHWDLPKRRDLGEVEIYPGEKVGQQQSRRPLHTSTPSQSLPACRYSRTKATMPIIITVNGICAQRSTTA